MRFRKINETTYSVEDLKELINVIEDYIKISSGGNIQAEILEEVVSTMVKYHVANTFFKTNINRDCGLGILNIKVPSSEVNVKRNIVRKDIDITVSEILMNKEGDTVRLCGKIRK